MGHWRLKPEFVVDDDEQICPDVAADTPAWTEYRPESGMRQSTTSCGVGGVDAHVVERAPNGSDGQVIGARRVFEQGAVADGVITS